MKIVQVNATCGIGSTGKICVGISEVMSLNNVDNQIIYSYLSNGYYAGISCADDKYIKIQSLKSRILGNYGFNSNKATEKMIREIEYIAPDIVHLHNLHSHNCNLEVLFKYFKETKTKLIWTFHDCWAFTGYCTYFDMTNCDKWKTKCFKCPKWREYSWFFDNSLKNYETKKTLFKGLDLTIVTPSIWLRDLVKRSFLKEYPVIVINNGIDLNVFKPLESNFREKYDLVNKKIVLGVSLEWGARKGLDVFIDLSKRLPENYKIVLIGTDSRIDELLSKDIISIHRTHNQRELAEIYSAADVFVNPTREENFPTVNLESLACGTPVLTYKTGGSPEMIDNTCGAIVDCNDIDSLEQEILRACGEHCYAKEACVRKAKQFDQQDRFKEYLVLYEKVITTRN